MSQRERVERRLYVADDAGGVRVYDIDRGHQFVRTIAVPNSGVYKGIAASVSLGRLYLTSNSPDTFDLPGSRERPGSLAQDAWIVRRQPRHHA